MTTTNPSLAADEPWYRRTYRWGQTNLTENDPERYDDNWWRKHWRDTAVQGVIINAGGIVAYYPSKLPLHHRAEALGDRDLYGEIVTSARDEGLTVVARMDSNRVAEDFFAAHPDWICRDKDQNPIKAADKYITCVNSPYYSDYLPQVLTEIIERSQPDGFADNSWAGLPRSSICYCQHCADLFQQTSGLTLPTEHDWTSENYRAWVRWNYQRRTDIWDLNNKVTTSAGGPDCLWFGMLSGEVLNNSQRFIDLRAILQRSELIMLDHQRRNAADGFEHNTEAGRRLHELLGWDKLIPESTPQYQNAEPSFRVGSMPEAEVRLWATAGFAGGIQPWWHHIGSQHDDRRQYRYARALFGWHRDNLDVLVDRTPVADVGVVWSQQNNDFGGRDQARTITHDPYRGVVRALNTAGVGYLPVHVDDLETARDRFSVLVLPNLMVLSDAQLAAITAFAEAGGSVIATGETSRLDGDGARRTSLGLGDLFGIEFTEDAHGARGMADINIEVHERHSYLRLAPELRAGVDGPADQSAPAPDGSRHPVLARLDETDLLPFGGYLPVAEVSGSDLEVLATFVPDFPIFPPETSWMRTPRTDVPAVLAGRHRAGGRLVWLLADLDRGFAHDEQPDHATVIANAVRWAIGGRPSCQIDGHGLVNGSLFRQQGRTILHLTNRVMTSKVPGREPYVVPVGPVGVRIRNDDEVAPRISLRVGGGEIAGSVDDGYLSFTVDRVHDHEVVIIEHV
ncbi:alpha-amylase family protein [Microlunatus soli]|uniref:Beta-galactosidase trimerisation domain-containing protein n=1 Tax=Microlunatus soli TaxID=630515 RepID=A0A1H1QL06_9ACTN|nr:alpha-amylase family protein [Microlunatus soli]SDS24085.1 Beta-galactosidase trimerisation domain-containing protein [Microlunatus soli]